MEKREISSCRGKEWCPAEYDSHCMLSEEKFDTVYDGIPDSCPLRKSPILLQLKAEVLVGMQNAKRNKSP
jgi:hypothetical protein